MSGDVFTCFILHDATMVLGTMSEKKGVNLTILLVTFAVALLVSFFCSLAEALLLSMTPAQLAFLQERHPRVGAHWQALKASLERTIAVILVVNTTANTAGAFVVGAQFQRLFGGSRAWVASAVLTFLVLQFGEILPKTIGVQRTTMSARLLGQPLRALVVLFGPLVTVVQLINRPFRGRSPLPHRVVDEITALAGVARRSDEIGPQEEKIIRGVARLGHTTAAQVMIPAEAVGFLDEEMTLTDALVIAHTDAHTRYPVRARDDKQRVIGYVNFKELIYFMRTNPRDPSLRGVTRPVLSVAPATPVREILEIFVDQHTHLAIVVDENGRALGILTLEDIIEELLGDIQDEFDRLPRMCHELAGGTWMLGGGVPLAEVERRLRTNLGRGDRPLADWLAERMPDGPLPGATVRAGGYVFTVRRVRRRRVFEAAAAPAS